MGLYMESRSTLWHPHKSGQSEDYRSQCTQESTLSRGDFRKQARRSDSQIARRAQVNAQHRFPSRVHPRGQSAPLEFPAFLILVLLPLGPTPTQRELRSDSEPDERGGRRHAHADTEELAMLLLPRVRQGMRSALRLRRPVSDGSELRSGRGGRLDALVAIPIRFREHERERCGQASLPAAVVVIVFKYGDFSRSQG